MMKKTVLLLSILMVMIVLPAAAAWTLDSGYDSGASIYGGVRYRAFNNLVSTPQVFAGIPPVPDAAIWTFDRNTKKMPWNANTSFEILYNPSGSIPATSVISSTAGPVIYLRPRTGPVNYIEFVLVNANQANSVDVYITKINGEHVSGGFSGTGKKYWSATGTDTEFLTIEGFILKRGVPVEADASYIEIRFGYLEPKDELAPAVRNVRVSPDPVVRCDAVTISAKVDDASFGNSAIGSAEYALDGEAWTGMDAMDGTFDEVTEDVVASLGTDRYWEPGVHSVCVRGMDAAGNAHDGKTCNMFTVGYFFDGFFSPVTMADTNIARAGQAIPAKWTLSDNCGVIEDPASFSNLFSYPVTCGELSPAAEVVEEYAGSSGLQYFGNGLWQFNWKTPKTYSGTCRVMHVGFDDGQYSDPAEFMFR